MSREQQLFDALEGALTLIDVNKAPDWFVIMARAAIATPSAAQADEKPFGYWCTFANGYEEFSQTIPNMVDKATPLFARQGVKQEPMATEQYTALAHRIASKYTHRSDPEFTAYTFLPHILEQFVRAIEAATSKP